MPEYSAHTKPSILRARLADLAQELTQLRILQRPGWQIQYSSLNAERAMIQRILSESSPCQTLS
jgi:hypothetical protein